jgi:hypothetical protein
MRESPSNLTILKPARVRTEDRNIFLCLALSPVCLRNQTAECVDRVHSADLDSGGLHKN